METSYIYEKFEFVDKPSKFLIEIFYGVNEKLIFVDIQFNELL